MKFIIAALFATASAVDAAGEVASMKECSFATAATAAQ